jgi:hypothetical protein
VARAWLIPTSVANAGGAHAAGAGQVGDRLDAVCRPDTTELRPTYHYATDALFAPGTKA